MKTLCIYHSNCADGFGAAWCVRHALGEENVEFYPGVYQNAPPDVTGRDVIFVDFCYKRDVMLELAKSAKSILVLDHHKTAMEDMVPVKDERHDKEIFEWDGLLSEQTWDAYQVEGLSSEPFYPGFITTVFDMERSGAGLAWDFFHPFKTRPMLINFIEDRDLWRFQFSETRAVQANLFSYPYDFEVWDKLMAMGPLELQDFRREGEALERKHHKDIAELVTIVTRPMKFRVPRMDPTTTDGFFHYDTVVVPVANLPYTMTSDAGHLLCERDLYGKKPDGTIADDVTPHPFSGCFWDTPEGRVFSLRSRDDGADVGAIAKLYGGGGHAHASGFRVPFDQLEQFEP